MQVTKDTKIGELLEYDRGAAVILMQEGMHCVGCPASANESIAEACSVHGMDSAHLLGNLQAYFAQKK